MLLPASGARFDRGGEIIMGQAAFLAARKLSKRIVVTNLLEIPATAR